VFRTYASPCGSWKQKNPLLSKGFYHVAPTGFEPALPP